MVRSGRTLSGLRMLVVVLCGLVSAFWVFYTVRLLVVSHGLQTLRVGGRGAYAGAIVFPALALLFGWWAWRLTRGGKPAA